MSLFKILYDKLGKQTLIKIVNTKSGEFVSILPDTGGMLMDLVFSYGDNLLSVVDTYKTEQELKDTLSSSFKGSNLFPFPNRISKGNYNYRNINYQLEVNFPTENNAIHGLIFNMAFKVDNENCTNDFGEIALSYNSDKGFKGYPFPFSIKVKYVLSDSGLTIETSAKNTGNKIMPAGNGWHPYFGLNKKVNELQLSFPSTNLYPVDESMIPTGEKTVYTTFNSLDNINDTEFDSCFELNNSESKAEIKLMDQVNKTGIVVWQETGENKFNYLQVYTPEHRNSIAIEPMTCLPNAFNNNNGFIELNPSEEISFKWGVKKTIN